MSLIRHIAVATLCASAAFAAAEDKDWWSLKPIVRPAVPSAAANPIDAFIDAKLAEKGLTRSPEADRRTLIRRVSFDLIGLPPSPQEVEDFVKDASGDAYEKLIDRLLASPRYGERWARHWLDVVHYGETHGYDKDKPRPNAWPYRDYVIRAFNSDKPYARFLQEQIAGDILFPATRDGIEALGFIAAGPWDLIGHQEVPETKIDGQIARHLDRDDMVQNTIVTFNSLTVGCAQCHNHKFDPIPQADYYALQSVFAALDRTEVEYYPDESLSARSRQLKQSRTDLTARIAALEKPLKQKAGEALVQLDQKIQAASKPVKDSQGNATPDYGYHSAISRDQNSAKWVQVDLGKTAAIDRIVLLPCYDDYNKIGAGFGFPVRFKIEASDDPEFNSGVTLFWTRHDETFMNDLANPGLSAFAAKAGAGTIQGRYVRVTAVKLAPRKNDFIFALAELQVFDERKVNLALHQPVTALDSIEAPPRWRKTNLTDGLAPAPPAQAGKAQLLLERDELILSFADESTRKQLAEFKRQLKSTEADLRKLPPPSRVYAGAIHTGSGAFRGTGPDGGKPRVIRVLKRGDVKQPGAEVNPGALSALSALPARFDLPADHTEGDRRAALARWLADPRNPLTWRSIVNRVWQYHFGAGIVATPNDFGRNGAPPTHPELLDWLAADFRDRGGSIKSLHKLILTSATYRQSSNPQSAIRNPQSIDSSNTLLWHMPRTKLDAEAIRDSVLLVAGKLDPTLGGPGFQDFVITRPEHSPHYEYHLHDPEDPKSHRRSIYRFIVRSQLQPFMTALDCADPSIQVDRRNESLSPLQALALLNNGLMVTMSKHFAAKLDKAGGDLPAKIDRAFLDALSRRPTAAESQSFTEYAQRYGLENACRVIFNCNEFAFVD